jgi:hypothetical protein
MSEGDEPKFYTDAGVLPKSFPGEISRGRGSSVECCWGVRRHGAVSEWDISGLGYRHGSDESVGDDPCRAVGRARQPFVRGECLAPQCCSPDSTETLDPNGSGCPIAVGSACGSRSAQSSGIQSPSVGAIRVEPFGSSRCSTKFRFQSPGGFERKDRPHARAWWACVRR